MAKFKVEDKVRIREDLEVDKFYGGYQFIYEMENLKGEVVTIEKDLNGAYFIKEYYYLWSDEMLEEFKEDKMEKTFREVIADIKEGEVWSDGKVKIINKNNSIIIEFWCKVNSAEYTDDYKKFKLQRKEYTFEVAFKAYEEGKEIESKESGYKFKKIDGVDRYSTYKEIWNVNTDGFEIDEIRDNWYIND